MAQGSTLRLGKGARCSVLVKNLRPTREVTQCILNPAPRQRVTDLVAVRCGNITRGGLTYEAVYFTSPLFPDLELYTAKRFTIVTHEGHGDRIWSMPLQVDGTPAPAITDNEGQEINTDVFNANDRTDDIAHIRAEGFEVNNDNKAFPENVPVAGAPPVKVNQDGLY